MDNDSLDIEWDRWQLYYSKERALSYHDYFAADFSAVSSSRQLKQKVEELVERVEQFQRIHHTLSGPQKDPDGETPGSCTAIQFSLTQQNKALQLDKSLPLKEHQCPWKPCTSAQLFRKPVYRL